MKSYLLALDGSRESLLAAELAWQLAESNKAKVVAQTVVDSQSLWVFIGKDLPGIIGNGPYLAAHEAIYSALKMVSDTLLLAYEARAQGHNVECETVLDEGNTLDEITKRAKQNALVIMGHRRERDEHPGLPRYSLAQHLAYVCPTPLLIVQDPCEKWKTARLIVNENTFDVSTLNAFLEFAKALNLSQEIYCIATEESAAKFIAKVRSMIPTSEKVHVLSSEWEEGDPAWECATDVPASTLLVVATQDSKEGRKTCAGTDPGSFIHCLTLPAAVILPESKAVTESLSVVGQTKSSSKK
jgi:nucleotide-binding universal stress UspA family protein